MPGEMTTDQIRDEVVAWFRSQPEEWVPVRRFISQWNSGKTWGGGRVSAGAGRGILRALVKAGRLEKRLDYGRPTDRGIPSAFYRVL